MSVATQRWPRLDDVVEEIRGVIASASSIGCLAHRDADADSLGSALGFALSMRTRGCEVTVLVPDPMPRLLEHLPGYDTISMETPGDLDALFTFDCATLGRFGDKRSLVERTKVVVNVDHHVSNEGFGSINLIDPHASATGQVVHDLLRALGAPLTPEVATNLYAALLTDTGSFRHENTTEDALRLGADLVAEGADPGWVALKSYKSRSIAQMRLEGLAIAGMETSEDGRLIWSRVTQAMLHETGAEMMQSEGIIDSLQSIDSMQLAILFKEASAHSTKISVRSRDPYDATAICRPFGGGGHHRAAGADLRMSLADAEREVLAVATRLLDGSS